MYTELQISSISKAADDVVQSRLESVAIVKSREEQGYQNIDLFLRAKVFHAIPDALVKPQTDHAAIGLSA
jgi:hypothetical protein